MTRGLEAVFDAPDIKILEQDGRIQDAASFLRRPPPREILLDIVDHPLEWVDRDPCSSSKKLATLRLLRGSDTGMTTGR